MTLVVVSKKSVFHPIYLLELLVVSAFIIMSIPGY